MMKKLTIALGSAALLSLAASAAYADDVTTTDYGPQASTANDSGLYVGGELGYRWDGVNKQHRDGVNLKGAKTSGMAARADVGYAFNKYFSAELGYDYLGSYHSKLSDGSDSATLKRSLYAFDAMGKVTYPFANNVFVFGGFGAALVHAGNYKGSVDGIDVKTNGGSKNHIRPEGELGVGYKLTDNVSMDVSYRRIFGTGKPLRNMKNYLPSINMVGLGLTYKF